MDEIVEAAMRKWPNVPDVYGWLALDRRGNWLLRGERIANTALNAFIDRNYACDERGCWYFQNGPQRVFAALHATPFIFSLERPDGVMIATAHTGVSAQRIDAALLDDAGSLILATNLGPGLVHDRDLATALDAARDEFGLPATETAFNALQQVGAGQLYIETGSARLPLRCIAFRELAPRFHYEPNPAPPVTPATN
jgi:hypothetical protein